MARALVASMGGSMGIESAQGEDGGTTVTITLPTAGSA